MWRTNFHNLYYIKSCEVLLQLILVVLDDDNGMVTKIPLFEATIIEVIRLNNWVTGLIGECKRNREKYSTFNDDTDCFMFLA